MLPDFGISEMFVVAVVALIVVGPKDLPVLMRQIGQVLGRVRGMASEFRASFDEMARQSELDELRKEVEALRTGKAMYANPEDAARHADITDIYSNMEGGVAAEHSAHPDTPMSYHYDEEVLGLAPTAEPAAPQRAKLTSEPDAPETPTKLPKAGAAS